MGPAAANDARTSARVVSPMHDWVVVGSGYGGSVSALCLAEKGYSVVVLEQGRSFADEDFARSAYQLNKYF